MLYCSTFKRVLPLPSDGWEEVSGSYFCHTHTHSHRGEEGDSTHTSSGAKLVPKDGDCLISSAQLLIRGSALDKNKFLIRSEVQKTYHFLQQQKVKSIERITTITELVVVWSVCSMHTYGKIKASCGHSYSCNALRFCLRCCKEL